MIFIEDALVLKNMINNIVQCFYMKIASTLRTNRGIIIWGSGTLSAHSKKNLLRCGEEIYVVIRP